jgi:general secretion pathway protein D
MTSTGEMTAADSSQVVVLEVTNSLLINATMPQHERIQKIIEQVDTEATKETIPYEIYFLENQDPEHLATVLGKLIQETITSADGKIEKVVSKTDEQVTIIPDKNTFSLIVRANRKNQDWIAGLVERLDKRRPQVLIDVTLVEITQTDAFNYDLNVITSAPDLIRTSGLTGTLVPGQPPITATDITNKLAASGRSQFADFQSNSGNLTAFYGDKHINLLLQAIQSKNYGRVLAKPKILVNDNEPGMVKTADTTYVAKRSSIPVTSGSAGTSTTLIQTAVDYQSYEAGITLNITPHISQGDLLRLDIQLARSDFRTTEDSEKPPDKTSSELKTTVFVPDASTIILGGLLRLSQNKGGAKVPILGDIPLIGGLFRSIHNRDSQSKLYIFVKTEIIRPAGVFAEGAQDLKALSERNRQAFEKHERQFQNYQSWPGVKSKPTEPAKVLDAR